MTAVITDVHYRMSLALIRDLAQAGVRVVVCWREDSGAPLGFRSKYPARRVTLPREGWLEELYRLCSQIREEEGESPALLPVGAATLAALAPAGDLDAALPAGAILLLQPVEPSAMLLPDEIYVVATEDFALLRYLKPDPTTVGGLLLVTRNAARDPLPVRRDQLKKLFLVKGWVVRKVL